MNARKETYKNIHIFTFKDYKGEYNLNLAHKILIEKALKKCKGDVVLTAKENGIKPRNLLNKLHQHNINIQQYIK